MMNSLSKLALCLLFLLECRAASAQLTYANLYVDYDSVWQYKNLRIIPIRRKGSGDPLGTLGDVVPLSTALRQGLVTVTERGTTSIDNVPWLRFNTNSDKSIFIAGGEIISGGRQDRMVVRDTILKPLAKDQYVPVFCVEEGRWSEKEKKFGYGAFANGHLRKVLDSMHNQVQIWNEIGRQLDSGKFKNKTDAYLSRYQDKKYQVAGDDYFRYFMGRFRGTDSTIVGFVAISGDKVIGSDIFASKGMFYGQLEPLLRGYIDEATLFGAPVIMKDPPIKSYIDKLLKDEASQQEFVRRNGKIFRQAGQVVHVSTFLKE